MTGWVLFNIGTLGAIGLLILAFISIVAGAVKERRQKAKALAYKESWKDWGTKTDLRRTA